MSTSPMLPSMEADKCGSHFPYLPPNSVTPFYLMQLLLSTHGLHLSTIKAQNLGFSLEAVDSSVPSPSPAVIPLVGTVLATTLTLVLSPLKKWESSRVVNGAVKRGNFYVVQIRHGKVSLFVHAHSCSTGTPCLCFSTHGPAFALALLG